MHMQERSGQAGALDQTQLVGLSGAQRLGQRRIVFLCSPVCFTYGLLFEVLSSSLNSGA